MNLIKNKRLKVKLSWWSGMWGPWLISKGTYYCVHTCTAHGTVESYAQLHLYPDLIIHLLGLSSLPHPSYSYISFCRPIPSESAIVHIRNRFTMLQFPRFRMHAAFHHLYAATAKAAAAERAVTNPTAIAEDVNEFRIPRFEHLSRLSERDQGKFGTKPSRRRPNVKIC